MARKVDLNELRRVIELGATDAAKDAGLVHFAISVRVEELIVEPEIEIVIVQLTPEQAAEIRAEQAAHQAAESAKRSAGN